MKPEFFQICIQILEARHLAWPGIDPQVCVQVDKEKRFTAVRENTDRPYYNEVKIIVYIFKDNKSHVRFKVLTAVFMKSSIVITTAVRNANPMIQCVSRMRKRPFNGASGATFLRHYRALRR
jgi:hypothetical protein